jgi:hypothetical protein
MSDLGPAVSRPRAPCSAAREAASQGRELGRQGIVNFSERWGKERRFSERRGQVVGPVLEISRQAATSRSREARQKSAVGDLGQLHL